MGSGNIERFVSFQPQRQDERTHVIRMGGGWRVPVERQADEDGEVQGVWLTGHDESTGKYEVLYYDTNFGRQASRIYETNLKNNTWRKWRNAKGSSQRFKGTLNPDKNRIQGQWESSEDGVRWKHDFDLLYTKLGSDGGLD